MEKCEVCGKEFKDHQGLAGHMRFKHGESRNESNKETKLPIKSMPVDALIRELELPELSNGTQQVFDAGVVYGMKSILIGVRVAQELSRMGVDQATPIIKMAQEMRQAEGQAAEVAAREAAEETAARVAAYFDQKRPDIATVPDPFKGFLARAVETMWDMMSKRMLGGAQTGSAQLPPGWVDKRQQGG